MMWRSIYALLLAMVCCNLSQAQPVELKWKLEKGKTFFEEHTTDTRQTMRVMGMDFTQGHRQTFDFSWAPREQDQNGNWVARQRIEAIKMELDAGGQKLNFDSTKNNNAANDLTNFFQALVGTEFITTITPEFKVVKIDGKEDFLKKLVAANQQTPPELRKMLTDDMLKQMTDPALAMTPGKPVSPGESWTKQSRLNMGPIGNYDLTHKYTYEGRDLQDQNLARIGVEVALKFGLPTDDAAAQLPFKLKKADLRSSEGRGTAWFDIAQGRLARFEVDLKLAGKLNIEIGGNTSEVDLNQTQKIIIKTKGQ